VKVLVVEDQVRMASLLKRGLTEEGHSVQVTVDGAEGLWLATAQPFDAVVLDVMLPGMDGFTVCRNMRAAGCWTPVLMLTARDGVQDRVRGLDAGADDYLVKPFSFAELAARVRALGRREGRDRTAALEVGGLRLDPATAQAWRDDTPVALSAKEFALLQLFLRHPGEVLSRARILEHVWDFAYEAQSNVVDQYVAYLRRKVDRPFDVEQIETVRGFGYRLREVPRPLVDEPAL
jgi:two-component system OmpR family response regulator